MDVSNLCLEQLLKFLESKQTEATPAPIPTAFRLVLVTEGNLDVLKVLSDTCVFREEVKKPKKKKAKNAPPEEEEVILEDPMYETLRRKALKSLYCVVRALHSENETMNDLKIAVAKIDGFSKNLCDLLMVLKSDLVKESIDLRMKSIQDCIYAMMMLVFVLRHSADAAVAFTKSELVSCLRELAAEKRLTLYCIQILELLSAQKEGIALLNTADSQALLQELLTGASKALNEPAEDAPAVNAKDKGAKKEAPKKGAPEVVMEDPLEKLDWIAVVPQRSALVSIKLLGKVYIALGSQLNATFDLDIVRDVAVILSKTLLNPSAHEIYRSALQQAPFDESLTDSIDVLCIAVGTLGQVSAPVRSAAYQNGALSAALTVLFSSQSIVAGPAPAAVAPGAKGAPAVEVPPPLSAEELTLQKQRLTQLRRVSEKAVLNLVTESLDSPLDDLLAGHVSHGINLPVRWASCFARKSDDAAFGAGDASLSAKLCAMLSVADDDDLANRGVRILAAILHGHHHPVELIESKGLHNAFVKPLSQLVQLRGQALVAMEVENDIRKSAEQLKSAFAPTATSEVEEVEVDGISTAMAAVSIESSEAKANEEKKEEIADTKASVAKIDILIPTVSETFFLALSIMELFLLSTPETVNEFTTPERVEVLADLIRALGPVGNPNSTPSACGVTSKVTEFEAVLHDPRRHDWSLQNPLTYSDVVVVRPLILDVLALTAGAGPKYRTYEGPLPAPPCEPVPASTSPCEEASLITCKLAADACCAVLLSQSEFCWANTRGQSLLSVKPMPSCALLAAVQDAALSLLRNIANCGARGVAGAVGVISSAGFAFIARPGDNISLDDLSKVNMNDAVKSVISARCSMSNLASTLARVVVDSPANDGQAPSLQQLVPAGYAWKRPQFFDEVFPGQDIPTSEESILSNQQLWPFVVFSAAFIGTLANPATSRAASALTLDALSAAVRLQVLEDHSQPVVADAVAATFLALGGGVGIAGLLGRFGNVAADMKPAGEQLAYYLFNRGHRREAFWKDWELSHREEVLIDPKTGKPIAKKDDKKAKEAKPADKKKDPKAVEIVPAVAEVELNVESTEAFPDPNHGPVASLWTKLLDVSSDDLHEHCPQSSALISMAQGSLSELAVFLINQGAWVDGRDGSGHSALMYALLMNDSSVVATLMSKNVDFDIIDAERNPTVKYAILSLSPDDIDRVFVGPYAAPFDSSRPPETKMLGRPTLLQCLFDSHMEMDFRVAGPRGQGPIMLAIGLGELQLCIGGYPVHIQNASYSDSDTSSIEQVHLDVENLIRAGADVNFCNVDGIAPLHIAAARGDIKLMHALVEHGAIPNALDNAGFLPLHYMAACCPESALAGFDVLFKYSSNRHLERMKFSDYRTGVPKEEKDRLELELLMNAAYAEAVSPSVISKKRLGPAEVLHLTTDTNLNVLQLCFCAPILLAENAQLNNFIGGNKENRMALALHIIQCAEKVATSPAALLTHQDQGTGLTTLHAASLLFQGMTPQIYLTDREKKAKRVRKFVSNEARLLDYFYQHVDGAVFNQVCTCPLPALSLTQWTLMHPAVFWDNHELASCLLLKGFTIEDTEMVHFLSEWCPTASEQLVRVILDAAIASPKHRSLLNDRGSVHSPARPLHLAVRNRNLNAVRALAACVKVDLNSVDEISGKTALHEACELGAVNLVQAFIPGADRLDLFASSSSAPPLSPNQEGSFKGACTPLNVILNALDIHLLQELIFMRKNDVIQQLLQITNSENVGSSNPFGTEAVAATLLYALERDNAELAKKLGINIPPTVPLAPQQTGAIDEVEDGTDAAAGSKEFVERSGVGSEELEVENPVVEGVPHEPISAPEVAPTESPPLLEDLDVIDQSGIGGRALMDRKRNLALFRKSNAVLRVIIELVNGSGIIGEGDHYHPYYFAGVLVDL